MSDSKKASASLSCKDMGCQLFGVYRCAISIKDASLLMHSTVGCNWGPLMFHTQSRMQDIRQASTVMYEEDIIYGGEAILQKALKHMLAYFPSKIIFVLTGCVPELIGDDTIKTIHDYPTDRDIILLSSPGFRSTAHDGILSAMKLLIHRLKEKPFRKNTVNLIGFFAEDDRVDSDLQQIISLLPDFISLNAVFPYDTWENIQNIPAAALNIVLEGFDFAGELLKDSFGTPFVTIRCPYGLEGSRKFTQTVYEAFATAPDFTHFDLQEKAALHQTEQAYYYINQLKGVTVALHGPSYRMSGLIDMLEQELQMQVVYYSDTATKDLDREQLIHSGASVLLGNSFDRDTAHQMEIAFLPIAYPVFDKITITDRAYCGVAGMVNLIEDLINTALF